VKSGTATWPEIVPEFPDLLGDLALDSELLVLDERGAPQ
jgi:hypothetical protein